MAAIPYDVAESFVNREGARRGAFTSHGSSIYSYDLELARHAPTDTVHGIGVIDLSVDLDAARKISATTARHVNALRAVLDWHPGLRVYNVDGSIFRDRGPDTDDARAGRRMLESQRERAAAHRDRRDWR